MAPPGVVAWFTGRPASGKSTLAAQVAEHLAADHGVRPVLLDSDRLRAVMVPAHGYDPEGRRQFYATLGNLAAELSGQGHAVLVAATANLREYRDAARERAPAFLEIYVSTPASECASRDPKGLYARAAADDDMTLPGAGAPFEPPRAPDFEAAAGADDPLATRIAAEIAARAARSPL